MKEKASLIQKIVNDEELLKDKINSFANMIGWHSVVNILDQVIEYIKKQAEKDGASLEATAHKIFRDAEKELKEVIQDIGGKIDE